jgi:outer membrane protein assembly factor BamB
MSRLMISKRSVALVALMSATVAVTGCSTVSKLNPFHGKDKNKSTATQGQRISVIAFDQKVEPNEALKGADFFLPEPAQAEWPPAWRQRRAVDRARQAAGKAFEIAWKKGFGKKGQPTFHVTAPPVAIVAAST